jgi:hypothetical protein
MTEIIKDDIAPGPKRRKTEKAVIDAGGTPVILAYDEVNDRTVMVRGDIAGGMKVIGMLYDPVEGEYIPGHGAEQGGMNKAFINTDSLEEKVENVIEELRILNMHMSHITDIWLNREDMDKE